MNKRRFLPRKTWFSAKRVVKNGMSLSSAPQTLEGIWSDLKKSKVFPFAVDSFGDCYYVELTGKDSNRCPVMYHHHDGSDVELVSNSLEEFLGWHWCK